MEWQLQDAKNRLSQLVKDACSKGPQVITLRGERTAVVISAKDFDRLQPKSMSFKDYLLSGPQWDEEFIDTVNNRDKSPVRDIEF